MKFRLTAYKVRLLSLALPLLLFSLAFWSGPLNIITPNTKLRIELGRPFAADPRFQESRNYTRYNLAPGTDLATPDWALLARRYHPQKEGAIRNANSLLGVQHGQIRIPLLP
jgi:hypothetical protein